jgi:hypothetical protein
MNKNPLLSAVELALKDEWEASHKIAQDHSNSIANWIHAVLHKIEGDEWNSKYWYARTDGRAYKDFADARAELLEIQRTLISSGQFK